VVEVAGALGLILPPLTGIAPGLAVWAAGGLAVVQLLAAIFHLSRGEKSDLWLNAVLATVALVALVLATRW
jgi:hypothetical protein